MIDLHIHTAYSADGTVPVHELLDMAEQKKLSVLSITDHNTVDAYTELEEESVRKRFSGRIIPGIELGAVLDGQAIEILGYDIDTKEMAKLVQGYPPCSYFDFMSSRTKEKLAQFGLEPPTQDTGKSLTALFKAVFNLHKDAIQKIDKNIVDSNSLFRGGLTNKRSKFYIGFEDFYKSSDEIITWIHDCRGKAFAAHPDEYGIYADEIRNALKKSIDGVECIHYSSSPQRRKSHIDFCKSNNLLISGGSDFHGARKPTVELGVGKGDIHVPEEFINWAEKFV